MNVCFCDIDGVLNFSSYGEDIYYDKFHDKEIALDQECVDNFLKLLEIFPDLKIVWSTGWRFDDNVYWNTWRNPRKYLEETYPILKSRVIGKTPRKMSSERFHEIKWWLDRHSNEILNYVILDDIKFPNPWFGIERHCVECKYDHGFDNEALKKAIEILNTPELYG